MHALIKIGGTFLDYPAKGASQKDHPSEISLGHFRPPTPRARYSSMYESKNRSHLLSVVLQNEKGGEPALARLYAIETNNMTPNMTAL